MINILVGSNASGKTLYLKNMLKTYPNAVTNFPEYIVSGKEVDTSRAEILKNVLTVSDVRVMKHGVQVIDDWQSFSHEMLDIFDLLMIKSDFIILDEPDLLLCEEEKQILVNVLFEFLRTYSVSWLTTHDCGMLNIPQSRLYTTVRLVGTSDVVLNEVTSEDVYGNFT